MRLRCRVAGDIPLPEVSGLAVAGVGGEQALLAVGDRHAVIASSQLGVGSLPSGAWQVSDLAGLPGFPMALGGGSQAEAIASGAPGQVMVLWEHPNLLLVLEGGPVAHAIDLVVAPSGPAAWLAGSWSDPDSSHGEGLILLRDGHLLVAKEKHPAAVIEFGPPGARPLAAEVQSLLRPGQAWQVTGSSLAALAAWEVPGAGMSDISDAAVTADGELLLLSDQDQALHVVGLAQFPEVVLRASYELRGLSGKPEGVAVTADGGLLVATDTRHARDNLYQVPPGWRD